MSNLEGEVNVRQLHRELRRQWDINQALLNALRDFPEFPEPFVLKELNQAADWSRHHPLGKQLQQEHGLQAIPPNSECEGGAGFWHELRTAILKAREGKPHD